MKTLRQLILDLRKLVDENPELGEAMVVSEHSASGAVDHINSFHATEVSAYDVRSEFGCFYEDEGLKEGDKIIKLSVGGY